MSLMSKRSTLRRFCCLLATAVVATGVGGASQAWGAFGIAGFDGAVSDSSGAAYTQAGGHPDSASVTLQLNRTTTADGSVIADGGDLREAKVELPPGLVGNPTAMPKCPKNLDLPSEDEGATGSTYEVNKFCPVNTIVGTAVVTLSWTDQEVVLGAAPVFNLEPLPGKPAQLGFTFLNQKVMLDAELRSDGDYGVDVVARQANQARAVLGSTVTLWGVPADHSHDNQRCLWYTTPGALPGEGDPPSQCDLNPFTKLLTPWRAPNAASVKPQAFLSNPTACTPAGEGLETRLRVESWNPASAPDEASFISHLPPGFPSPPAEWGAPQGPDGCEKVPFNPSFKASSC